MATPIRRPEGAMRPGLVAPALALLLLFSPIAPTSDAPAEPLCAFGGGFRALHDALPEIVGECARNEMHNPVSGDALQVTEHGLLVWRKADNWTAFTNGAT